MSYTAASVLRLLALLLLPVCLILPQQVPLVDRLRSSEVSPSGVGSIFEFHADNQPESHSAIVSEGKYRLIGSDTISQPDKNREEKQELERDSLDRARIEDEATGESMELARVGKVSDRAQAGETESPLHTNQQPPRFHSAVPH